MAHTTHTHTRLASKHDPKGRQSGPATEAIEDYAKAIYALQHRGEGAAVGTSALAERLEVAPSTVTAMLKRLDAMGLATYEPYRGVTLTARGEQVALEVIRHHRLLEAFLADVGMPWDQVHDEAEVLEHYISEELEALIAKRLGDPLLDPHGDPIPSANLDLAADPTVALSALAPGESAVFARVSDADPAMLRFLAERGIRPGAELSVREAEPFGGRLVIEIEGAEHGLGAELAENMRVERRGVE